MLSNGQRPAPQFCEVIRKPWRPLQRARIEREAAARIGGNRPLGSSDPNAIGSTNAIVAKTLGIGEATVRRANAVIKADVTFSPTPAILAIAALVFRAGSCGDNLAPRGARFSLGGLPPLFFSASLAKTSLMLRAIAAAR
jgi:hypothetical protein